MYKSFKKIIAAILLSCLLCLCACTSGEKTSGCAGSKETENGNVDTSEETVMNSDTSGETVKEIETPGESGIDWEDQWGAEADDEWG